MTNLERWQREQTEIRRERELTEGINNLHAAYGEFQAARPGGVVTLDTKEALRGRFCVILLRDSIESVRLMRCEDELRYSVIPKLLAELQSLRRPKKARRKAA